MEQDYDRALKLINRSVQLRYGPGCRTLGEMYEKGEGVRQDLAIAIDMYKCAVEYGCEEAEKELERLVSTRNDDTTSDGNVT